MIAMRHGFVSAVGTVLVRAFGFGRTTRWVGGVDRDRVLVDMVPVHVMQMAVVQIIDMAAMGDGCVAAVRAMFVSVVGMVRLGATRHRSLHSVVRDQPATTGSTPLRNRKWEPTFGKDHDSNKEPKRHGGST
jgi:hypothetical protein